MAAAGTTIGCGALSAHPHASVEQQVAISFKPHRTVLRYAVAAGGESGAHVFTHLDSNGDGRIDKAEQTAFSRRLIAATGLRIDGQALRPVIVAMQFPATAAQARQGMPIRVTAAAVRPLSPRRGHKAQARLVFTELAPRWLLQPYIGESFASPDGVRVARSHDGAVLTLDF